MIDFKGPCLTFGKLRSTPRAPITKRVFLVFRLERSSGQGCVDACMRICLNPGWLHLDL